MSQNPSKKSYVPWMPRPLPCFWTSNSDAPSFSSVPPRRLLEARGRELLEQEGCAVTVCPAAAQGMGVSLAHGVSVTRDAGGWIVALADMPRIRPDTIRRVAQALEVGAEIVAPAYQGDRGHPVGFGRRFRHELEALIGDSGARAVVQRNQALVRLIDCDDSGILLDIDRRSDLTRSA